MKFWYVENCVLEEEKKKKGGGSSGTDVLRTSTHPLGKKKSSPGGQQRIACWFMEMKNVLVNVAK